MAAALAQSSIPKLSTSTSIVIDESRLRAVLSKLIRYIVTKGLLSEGLFDPTGQDAETAALKKKLAQTGASIPVNQQTII